MGLASRWRLIINGKSAGDDDLRAAVVALREQGVDLDVRVTWEGGDAERYVAEAVADGIDRIVAAGGDGTLSEVATTLAHRDEPADALPSLGLVPMGTANDFAAAAGIPVEPLAALQQVREMPARPMDLLRIDTEDGPHWSRQPGQRRIRHADHRGDRRGLEEDARRPGLPADRHRQAGQDRGAASAHPRAWIRLGRQIHRLGHRQRQAGRRRASPVPRSRHRRWAARFDRGARTVRGSGGHLGPAGAKAGRRLWKALRCVRGCPGWNWNRRNRSL